MPELSLSEAIEIIKVSLAQDFTGIRHPRLNEALSLVLSKLSLLEQVEKGGVEKKKVEKISYTDCSKGSGSIGVNKAGIQECVVKADQQYLEIKHEEWNESIDLCNAHWVKKLEGIEKIELPYPATFTLASPDGRCINIITLSHEATQAIITYLTKKEE